MSPYKRKLLRNFEARVLPLSILFLLVVAAFTGMFVILPRDDIVVSAASTSDFSYYKPITFTGSQIIGRLIDFPVLIHLSSDSDLASDALDSGWDIAFFNGTTDGAVQFCHDIQWFDQSSGELFVYVKIPFFSSSENSTVYMFYGDSDIAASAEDVQGTWSNYLAVYNGTSLVDATRDYNLTDSGSVSLNDTDGDIAGCFDFGTSDNKYLYNATLLDGGGDFSITCWVNPATLGADGTNDDYLIYKRQGANDGIYLFWNYDENDFRSRVEADDNNYYDIDDFGDLSTSTWHYMSFRWDDSSSWKVSCDSEEHSWGVVSHDFGSGSDNHFYIGAFAGAYFWDGLIDEIKVTSLVLNESWCHTEYNMFNNHSSGFASAGEEFSEVVGSLDFLGSPNNYFSTSGLAPGIYEANETGTYTETAQLTITINDGICEFIRVNVSDIDAVSLPANYINISFSSDNTTWGAYHQCVAGGESIMINGTNWTGNSYMCGTNPFTADGDSDGYNEIQATTSIYWRVNVTYPTGLSPATYSKLDMTFDGGVYT